MAFGLAASIEATVMSNRSASWLNVSPASIL